MHLSRILQLINVCEGRRELQAFYWLYLSYTLILIPLFWSHLRMSWNSTFRSNVIRRESLTDSQPLLHRQTSDLHKELPLWLISLINIHKSNSLSRCRRYTGGDHALICRLLSVCDRDQDLGPGEAKFTAAPRSMLRYVIQCLLLYFDLWLLTFGC